MSDCTLVTTNAEYVLAGLMITTLLLCMFSAGLCIYDELRDWKKRNA